MRSFIPILLAALVGSAAAVNGAGKDVNQKKGAVLYKAMYVNEQTQRTRAVYTGSYNSFDGSSTSTNNNLRNSIFFSMQVMDKKGQVLPWTNIFSIAVSDFPNSVIPTSFGIGANSIASETYQLTSLDKTTKANLGSLVWGGAWSDGGDFGAVTQVFPVLGATGVFKGAKSVAVKYNTDNTRQVTIYKTAL